MSTYDRLCSICDPNTYYNIREVHGLLESVGIMVSIWTVRKYVYNGKIPSIQLNGKNHDHQVLGQDLHEFFLGKVRQIV